MNTDKLFSHCTSWEIHHRTELESLYNIFFENNKLIKITYDEFVIYCYKHSLFTPKSTQWAV